tara:strand:- start:1517 stop:1807 length:291 start_codon:yes stop_codon:yes gene_type:complete
LENKFKVSILTWTQKVPLEDEGQDRINRIGVPCISFLNTTESVEGFTLKKQELPTINGSESFLREISNLVKSSGPPAGRLIGRINAIKSNQLNLKK